MQEPTKMWLHKVLTHAQIRRNEILDKRYQDKNLDGEHHIDSNFPKVPTPPNLPLKKKNHRNKVHHKIHKRGKI